MTAIAAEQESTFFEHRLDNGLQLVGQLMPDVESAAAVYWVNTGTRDEVPDEMGVSHFLEHMAFRRTATMVSEEIDRAFEEMGADHNAATGREMTFYWARVLSENVPWAIRILSELTHPILDAGDFDQERNIILEEIARADDQPAHVLFRHFLRTYFEDHPLALDTLGTPETIQALTVEQMRDYWRRRYGTSNLIFAIAGKFDWDSVVQEVQGVSEGWELGNGGRPGVPAPFRQGLHVMKRDQFVQEQIAIGTPLVSRNDPRYYTAAVLATILGDDRGSRLYWSLYQTGLAESVSAEALEFDDTGLMLVHISTEPQQAAEALRAARAELEQMQHGTIDPGELDRAKTKLNASVIIGGESTNERVMGLINSWLTEGRLETLEDVKRKIDAVTIKDVKQLLQDFPVWPEQHISAVGPLGEEELRAAIT